ncbi:MAG: polysaccharide deacetylase family protein [Bacillota bacterium]|nr:polysaccharide deacetylase family protein [Bacillota bacterium]
MPETSFPIGKRLLLLAFLFFLALTIFSLQVVTYFGLAPVKEVVLEVTKPKQVSAVPKTGYPVLNSIPVLEKPETKPLIPQAIQPAVGSSLPEVDPVEEPPSTKDPFPQQIPAGNGIPGVLRSVPCSSKKVALTFDDGPFQDLSPAYLKVLQEHEVRATFFPIGRHIRRALGMVSLIAQHGHEIGNHTFNHFNLTRISLESAEQELLMTAELIEQEVGYKTRFFRPPGGNLNQALVKMASDMGMQTVLWNIDPQDWGPVKKPEQLVEHILARVQPGSIVLLHEGKPQTLAALPPLITELKERGWQFVTLSELCAGNEAPQLPAQQPAQSSDPPSTGAPLPAQNVPFDTPPFAVSPPRI